MDFREVVRRRRMVRRYDPRRPVGRELLERALQAAVRAPSAGFAQGWDFVVLTEPAARQSFWAATADVERPDEWLAAMMTAPVLVLCLADPDRYLARYDRPDKAVGGRHRVAPWPVKYWHVDTGMAALLMLLSAVDDGLAGCFFGVPQDRWPALAQALDVPPGREPVGVVSLGYPAPGDRSRPLGGRRRPAADVVHWQRFGGRADTAD